ncbi:glycoside hydrolase family 3 N-terminal domain-containing protein [Nostocoides sp. Soil756]|uniref:glycoside hydrolase family 3 N-terminal domain-containing protein n=1 Tax=Nostocoides sp. Soil756 TaxID=1736399 RepID=UPI0009EB3EEE|nr:glycoside hydrolase family 3 N-terminal domain-containing protein [Tetrasphaera sp. Soil756]
MTSRPRPARRVAATLGGVLALAVAGCSGATPTSPPSTGGGLAPSSSSAAPTTATPSASSVPSPTATPSCVDQTEAALSEDQRIGQLLMVGFDTNASLSSLDDEIVRDHIGNVIYLGGWYGADKVTRTSEHLQGLVSQDATGGVGLLVAADQEGGEVHQLRGDGFTRPPTAREQARMSSAALTRAATGWARELKAAGVNVNLAPVTDTVPADLGRGNAPIGKYARQYGSDPATVERASKAFIIGMLQGGVEATVKHFPGLGRIRNNTDFSATGITDDTTSATDPYLQPFRAGVDAGAGLVMVGSARYTQLDPGVPAMFSKPIVTDLLRGDLGYDGVVITDDVNAKAVAATPPAQRAIKVVEAGGDIILTGDASVAPQMAAALAARAAADPTFQGLVDASVTRVLTLKDRMGLLSCSRGPQD